jgi:hypothetical protein
MKKSILSHSQNTYIKADDNTLINEKCITWVKQMDECLMVCAKKDGCDIRDWGYRITSTHKICKTNNPESYNKFIDILNR